jgi:hypothetical protein
VGVTLKSLLALLVVTLSAVGGTASAASPPYRYDEELSRIARETLWQSAAEGTGIRRGEVLSVGVRCYRTKQTFEESFERNTGISARKVLAYYRGGRDVHLREGTCQGVHLFLTGRRTVLTSGAYSILLHETLHRQGVRNERLTTCFADESVRWGARWFGATDEAALRARNLAFTYTRVYADPSYRMGRPNCLALTNRREWYELTKGT